MITKFDFCDMVSDIWLRVSFYDMNLDTQTSPIIYSQIIMVPANTKSKVQALWTNEKLPCLYSSCNTLELVKQSRLLMLIWACGPAQNFPDEEMLIGCTNIKLRGLEMEADGACRLDDCFKVTISNCQVGEVRIKLSYRTV